MSERKNTVLIPPGPACPMAKDGEHALHLFHDSSGVSCWRCHKTWGFVGDQLVPTYGAEIERLNKEPSS